MLLPSPSSPRSGIFHGLNAPRTSAPITAGIIAGSSEDSGAPPPPPPPPPFPAPLRSAAAETTTGATTFPPAQKNRFSLAMRVEESSPPLSERCRDADDDGASSTWGCERQLLPRTPLLPYSSSNFLAAFELAMAIFSAMRSWLGRSSSSAREWGFFFRGDFGRWIRQSNESDLWRWEDRRSLVGVETEGGGGGGGGVGGVVGDGPQASVAVAIIILTSEVELPPPSRFTFAVLASEESSGVGPTTPPLLISHCLNLSGGGGGILTSLTTGGPSVFLSSTTMIVRPDPLKPISGAASSMFGRSMDRAAIILGAPVSESNRLSNNEFLAEELLLPLVPILGVTSE
mmetsp:Transcript_10695/g.26367  ORF Transcript_10695/g.26367 Transcript_10695/m.26367 type:complete len:344 (+) Transcript_10695:2096-3127(+)